MIREIQTKAPNEKLVADLEELLAAAKAGTLTRFLSCYTNTQVHESGNYTISWYGFETATDTDLMIARLDRLKHALICDACGPDPDALDR